MRLGGIGEVERVNKVEELRLRNAGVGLIKEVPAISS